MQPPVPPQQSGQEPEYGQMPPQFPAHPDAQLMAGVPVAGQYAPGQGPYAGQDPTTLIPGRFTLGVVALVLGILSVVLAVIPFANYFVGLIGLAGFIVSIVALTRKYRPKRAAVWGLILSILGSILALILAVVYSFVMFGELVDDGTWQIGETDTGGIVEQDGEAEEFEFEFEFEWGDVDGNDDWVLNEDTGEWELVEHTDAG